MDNRYFVAMHYQDRIISDYRILLGKPVIKGTRISVELLLKKLSEGATVDDLATDYELAKEDIYAALNYASALMANEEELVVRK